MTGAALLDDLATLLADVDGWLDWQRACGAQILPLGGPSLPPLDDSPASPSSSVPRVAPPPARPPAAPPHRTPPAVPLRAPPPVASPVARGPETSPPRTPPPVPSPEPPPTRGAPRAQPLPGAWARLVDAPPKKLTGPQGLRQLAERLGPAPTCSSCHNRLDMGEGEGSSPVLIVSGTPFVPEGRRMLEAMLVHVLRLEPQTVLVLHLHHRCRSFFHPGPPDPLQDCGALLREQLGLVRPRLMLALGIEVSRALFSPLQVQVGRGRWAELPVSEASPVPTLMTFHPNLLLEQPQYKSTAFVDLKAFRARMDTDLP